MRKVALSIVTLGLGWLIACGGGSRRSGFETNGENGDKSGGFTEGETPCSGLACKQVDCGGGNTTTLTGKVYDPAGSNPLYNVMVYVPGGNDPNTLPAMKDSLTEGVSCEACASVVLNPLTSALTDTEGNFELKNVPVDANVPVVVQIGKWRRLFNIDITKKCAVNEVEDREFRLPKNGKEGNMPQIAVTAGGADALECLLRGIGIDASEFVRGADPKGHVHVFNGVGGKFSGAPDASTFWNDEELLKKYDITLLSCEGNTYLENKSNPGAMANYLRAGGRMFATHYHYSWFANSTDVEMNGIGSFHDSFAATDGAHDVNMSFAKGEAFGKWLTAVGASTTEGTINLDQMRDSVISINEPAIPWITSPADGGKPRYFSFNLPLHEAPENQCGRAVFSDLHITASSGPTSINGCSVGSGGLNESQRALEFFFFDLSACVSDDKVPPNAPK